MTGIAFEPTIAAPALATAGGEASVTPGQPDFAAVLAGLSGRDDGEPEGGAGVRDLLSLLRVLVQNPGVAPDRQGSPGHNDPGFLGGSGVAEAGPAAPSRDLAAIFNEFGLFGSPVIRDTEGVPDHQPCGLTPAAKAAASRPDTNGADPPPRPFAEDGERPADAVTPSSPGQDPGLTEGAAADARATAVGQPRAAAASAPSAPRYPAEPAPAAMVIANAPEAAEGADTRPAESRAPPRERPRQAGATEQVPSVHLSVGEHGARLVARLERLSSEEKIRLRDEAERLLAAFGLAATEIRINGAVERRRA